MRGRVRAGSGDRFEDIVGVDVVGALGAVHLESVQQSRFGSRFASQHFNLQIEMQIGAQMRRTVILILKPISNTSNLKIEMQIETKSYIFRSVHQLGKIATLTHKLM